ncbi:MAG: DUF4292 domain-containing protein [Bacteroides sp.]|nr:DUF4292 domain-containing protein [Bacteroides sp.]
MMRYIGIIGWMVLVLLASSCSSTKTVKKSVSIEGMTETEYVETVISNASDCSALTAKMALTLNLDGKGDTKVNGTLRIKRGEVIQLSIAPFLGIEVARAEFSPNGILVIDRMNKRYVQVSFADLGTLLKVDWNFHTLQALFLNELFIPGKLQLTSKDVSAFGLEQLPTGIWLDVKKSKRFRYRFLTEAPGGLLLKSRIELDGTPYGLSWDYADFQPLDEGRFPSVMNLLLNGGKRPVKVAFKLSRLSTNSDWEAHTQVSDKYEKVELEDLMKILLKK